MSCKRDSFGNPYKSLNIGRHTAKTTILHGMCHGGAGSDCLAQILVLLLPVV